MKYKGITLEPPAPVTLVLPLGNNEIVIKAARVFDYTDFDKLIKMPTPPTVDYGTRKEVDEKDPEYIEKLLKYFEKRETWTILKSLEATPDLEWERVDINNPETWDDYLEELKESGFSPLYINAIRGAVVQACNLDQKLIDEATERFLATQQES